jgi:hypothetical protein
MDEKHKKNRWLRSIGKYWILSSELAPNILLVGAFLGMFICFAIGQKNAGLTVFVVLISTSFIATAIQYHLFYHFIRCPRCGYNPTRYKNGKNIPTKTVYKRLQDLEYCPACPPISASDDGRTRRSTDP